MAERGTEPLGADEARAADRAAERKALEAAAADKWGQFAQPGFEDQAAATGEKARREQVARAMLDKFDAQGPDSAAVEAHGKEEALRAPLDNEELARATDIMLKQVEAQQLELNTQSGPKDPEAARDLEGAKQALLRLHSMAEGHIYSYGEDAQHVSQGMSIEDRLSNLEQKLRQHRVVRDGEIQSEGYQGSDYYNAARARAILGDVQERATATRVNLFEHEQPEYPDYLRGPLTLEAVDEANRRAGTANQEPEEAEAA